MASAKETVLGLVNHPFSFAVGVGLANGLLAIGRGKKIDPKTATTLATILGLGELALVVYEPPSERGKYSLTEVGVYSVLGVLCGVLPFVTWGTIEHGEAAHPGLVAEANPPEALPAGPSAAQPSAVGGYSSNRSRVRRRRAA